MDTDTSRHPSYIVYSDESHFNVGRYRGLAAISLPYEQAPVISGRLRAIVTGAGIGELKWDKVRNARYQFPSERALTCGIELAAQGALRIDVLTWDTHDSRHSIVGRDDIANLERMYYHLFRDVLSKRWPSGTWWLFPDEQTAVQWDSLAEFVDGAGLTAELEPPLFGQGSFRLTLSQQFSVEMVKPIRSCDEPIVQLADLCVGLAIYSRENYQRFVAWRQATGLQPSLLPIDDPVALSSADGPRCTLLDKVNAECKSRRLSVSLDKHHGLRTLNPVKPVNFWWYEPQSDKDKAPTRDGK